MSEKENAKDSQLGNLLEKLANDIDYSTKDHGQDIDTLSKIYSEDYRHSYAKISLKVQNILENDASKGECLSNNIQVLKDEIIKKSVSSQVESDNNLKNLLKNVIKLSDHVNLEIGRYNLLTEKINRIVIEKAVKENPQKVHDQDIEDRLNRLEKSQEKSENTVLNAAEKLDKVDEKLERNSMSSITTLTIFSAVILAFTGSITFTSGVFSGMTAVSSFRIVFITALIGLVVFNLIFMLLFIVGRMVDKSVCCKCKYYTEDESVIECGSGYCNKKLHMQNGICILLHKYPYVFIIDLFIIGIIYYDAILFFLNNPHYLWFKLNHIIKCFAIIFPIVVCVIIYIVWKIYQKIMYNRCMTEVSVKITEEFFPPKKSAIYKITDMLANSLSRLFSSTFEEESDKDKILKKLSDHQESERMKILQQELDFYSEERLLLGKERLHYIGYKEHIYNKKKKEKNIEKILDDIKTESYGDDDIEIIDDDYREV